MTTQQQNGNTNSQANVRFLYGTLVDAAFALELGRIRGEDYTNPNVVRPRYITRQELIRIGVENGSFAHAKSFIERPNTRRDYMTDEMLSTDPTVRPSFARFNKKLGVPGKATQTPKSAKTPRDPNGPRLPDGTPQYKMDIFYDALDHVLANMPRAQFDVESQRVPLVAGADVEE